MKSHRNYHFTITKDIGIIRILKFTLIWKNLQNAPKESAEFNGAPHIRIGKYSLRAMKAISCMAMMFLMACGTSEVYRNTSMPSEYETLNAPMETVRMQLSTTVNIATGADVSNVPFYVVTSEEFESLIEAEGKFGFYNKYGRFVVLKKDIGEVCKVMAHELLHAALDQQTGDGDSAHLDTRFHDKTFSEWCSNI